MPTTDTTVVAGLDVGTSSAKLVVATADGEVLARAHAPYPTLEGPSGHFEQHPEDWRQAVATAVARTGLGERIDAVGVTGQMQDLIPVAGARALRPALLYSDMRAGE